MYRERTKTYKLFLSITAFCLLYIGLMLPKSGNTQESVAVDNDQTNFNPLVDNIIDKLPPLNILIDSAIKNSPYIKYEIAEVRLWNHKVTETQRYWTRLFGVDAGFRYGNFYQFSTNETTGGFPTDFSSDKYEYRYNVGVFVRIPFYDVINHRNNVNIAKREVEKRMLKKEQIIRETKQEVIFVYEDLVLRQDLLKMKNEARLTTSMQVEMAEKEFLNGSISIAELSRLTEIHSRNVSEYKSERSKFHRQYLILEELVGMKFNLLSEIY